MLVKESNPDAVIMEVNLPDGSGIQACREIVSMKPSIRVLMFTTCADGDIVYAAIVAGAAGYLLKHTDPERLPEAISVALGGQWLLDARLVPSTMQAIRRNGGRGDRGDLASLSEHELAILKLIADGKTNREIAHILCLSEHTVKQYVSNILQKLHLARRAQAAALIAQYGLLSIDGAGARA